MIDAKTAVCEVFISHAPRDAALALELAAAFRQSGLSAFTNTELLSAADSSDALWDGLAESLALVVVLSPSEPTSSMWIEIGAAQAWNKPIYALATDGTSTHLPVALTGIPLYSSGRVQDVIEAIRIKAGQLSETDREFLARDFAAIALPVDQLALEPARLDDLVKRFRKETGKRFSGERLLSELLRLRKQGRLPAHRSSGRSRQRREPA